MTKTLQPYSPSLPRPVSGLLEEHHFQQCFRRFKMTPVALAVMALGMFTHMQHTTTGRIKEGV